MDTDASLLGFFLLGAAGSVHCVGMCGGFALSVAAMAGDAKRRVLAHALLFGLGKAFTYVVLGLAVRAGYEQFVDAGHSVGLHSARRVAAAIAGLVMVAYGLAWAGLLPAPRPGSILRRVSLRLGPLMNLVRQLGGRTAAFATGVVTGLLPCGLSWAAMALATQSSPQSAALGLFTFGLATTPALTILALGWGAVSTKTRARAQRVLGLGIVAFGLVTMIRGGTVPLGASGPECCIDAEAE